MDLQLCSRRHLKCGIINNNFCTANEHSPCCTCLCIWKDNIEKTKILNKEFLNILGNSYTVITFSLFITVTDMCTGLTNFIWPQWKRMYADMYVNGEPPQTKSKVLYIEKHYIGICSVTMWILMFLKNNYDDLCIIIPDTHSDRQADGKAQSPHTQTYNPAAFCMHPSMHPCPVPAPSGKETQENPKKECVCGVCFTSELNRCTKITKLDFLDFFLTEVFLGTGKIIVILNKILNKCIRQLLLVKCPQTDSVCNQSRFQLFNLILCGPY